MLQLSYPALSHVYVCIDYTYHSSILMLDLKICRETHSEIVVCAKQGNREYMEDQHIIVPCISLPLPSRSLDEAFTCTLVGVFDGHGGVEAAEYCKLNIARVFSDCISKCAEADMHKVLANTFKCLDEGVSWLFLLSFQSC